MLGERLIVHSAHEFSTSLEHFRRLVAVIESTPALSKKVKPRGIKNSHGSEGVELKDGSRINFKARHKGSLRGFTADCLIFDEAWNLPETSHGAVLPTLSTRPDPQIIYAGTAVDQRIHENGVVLSRVRHRGMEGTDQSLAYFEWSADFENPEQIPEAAAIDPEEWTKANPALGVRITEDYIAREQATLDSRSFAVERLGVGDWPDPEGDGAQVIPREVWKSCLDPESQIVGAPVFAFDVHPNRETACISVAGTRTDDLHHIEVIEHRGGTGWLLERLCELNREHEPIAIVCDERGPAASFIEPLQRLEVEVTTVNSSEYARACGSFYDEADQRRFRHLGSIELDNAVKGAAQRTLSDAWAWSRKSSTVDITPLVACTLALWGVGNAVQTPEPFVEVF